MNKKQSYALMLICCLSVSAFSQVTVDFNVKADTVKVEKYKHQFASNVVNLRMTYADYKIKNPENIKRLKGESILQVDLIYTDYPKDKDSDLLNKRRFAALYSAAPEIFEQKDVKWSIIEQTGATSSDVFNYFHGFVIKYASYETTPHETGEYIESTADKSFLKNIVEGKTEPEDSTVLKVMDRHKWKNMVVVTDFTGSMSPYVGEILLWHKLNTDVNKPRINRFVFFNDGDSKEDYEKKIGRTGGIHYTSKIDMDHVLEVAVETISRGSGGDEPENDIEALIFAQKLNPRASNFVLIADNTADVRDLELAYKLKHPVKIVLCGVKDYINTEYLDLAYKTGGSVHTIEEDIKDLKKIKEGASLVIGGQLYFMKDGKFNHN